jgi:hypothetical protein
MEKFDVGRSIAPGLQGSLPGFPVVEEEHGRSARKRSLTDRSRARRACAPMGTLVSIVVSRDARNERRVWYVVEPDMQLAPQYAAQGIPLEPNCKVLIDAEVLRPVALLEIDPADASDNEMPTPLGFNPYWDMPPA